MLPNFFVIGAGKAGTTSLHGYLSRHPEIHMSAVKEPNYFAPVDLSEAGRRHSPIVTDRETYEALFETDAPLRGESSGAYSTHPRRPGVPERIHAEVPEARLVYLVRDPIDRIRAFYMQRASMADYGSFGEAIGDISDPANDYVCPSRYMTQIEQYLPFFEADRILVIDNDALRGSRRETLARIFRFLGADPDFWTDEFNAVVNPSAEKRRYSGPYARVAKAPAMRRALAVLPERTRAAAGARARRLLRRPLPLPEIPAELRVRLEEMLAPEVERLRGFTGESFSGWSV